MTSYAFAKKAHNFRSSLPPTALNDGTRPDDWRRYKLTFFKLKGEIKGVLFWRDFRLEAESKSWSGRSTLRKWVMNRKVKGDSLEGPRNEIWKGKKK